MKLSGSCIDKQFIFFTTHNYSKWKEFGVEQRTEGESSILGGSQITWQGMMSKQKRECKDCGDLDYQEKKL